MEMETSLFLTNVYQCRICGSLIPTEECAESHGRDCRPATASNHQTKTKSWKFKEQMDEITFPCPRVVLHKLPGNEQPSTSLSSGDSNLQKIILSMDIKNLAAHIKCPETTDKVVVETDERLFVFPDADNDSESDAEESTEIHSFQPDKPYACPLKRCSAKLRNRVQLKSHFITHLKNNPYACPIPDCKVRLSAQRKFKEHMESHLGQGQDQEEFDEVKRCIRGHYANLKSRGLLLKESDGHALNFDFKYKVDIETIAETDPVILKVSKYDRYFYDRIFIEDEKQPQQPRISKGRHPLDEDDTTSDTDNEGIRGIRANFYACPLKRCRAELGSRRELKSHFVIHLQNNPYACPIPNCASRFDAQSDFKHHVETHMGLHRSCVGYCVQTFSTEDKLWNHSCPREDRAHAWKKMKEESDQAKEHLGRHYANLKSKGLLLEETYDLLDFTWIVNVDLIFQTDPVYLQVCKYDKSFHQLLFGDKAVDDLDFHGASVYNDDIDISSVEMQRALENSLKIQTLGLLEEKTEEVSHDFSRSRYSDEEEQADAQNCGHNLQQNLIAPINNLNPTNEIHDAAQSDANLKKLKNGKYKCTKCKFTTKSEGVGKRHLFNKHKASQDDSTAKSKPSSKMSRKRKGLEDKIPDTNVKAVKVEPELDLCLSIIVPKEEVEVHLDIKSEIKEEDHDSVVAAADGTQEGADWDLEDIKPEIPSDQAKEEDQDIIVPMDMDVNCHQSEQPSSLTSEPSETENMESIVDEHRAEADRGYERSSDSDTTDPDVQERARTSSSGHMAETNPCTATTQQTINCIATVSYVKLQNGNYKCVDCNYERESEDSVKMHCFICHAHAHDHDSNSSKNATLNMKNVENRRVKATKSKKVKDKLLPSKKKTKDSNIVLVDGEKPNCSKKSTAKQSGKQKLPKDLIPNSNVKGVKVEAELDLGLSVIVPKEEESACKLYIKSDIKEEDQDTVATATSTGTDDESLINSAAAAFM